MLILLPLEIEDTVDSSDCARGRNPPGFLAIQPGDIKSIFYGSGLSGEPAGFQTLAFNNPRKVELAALVGLGRFSFLLRASWIH
jgi:hypothetical protein